MKCNHLEWSEMAFLIGSSHREFQNEVSGGMETSQAVITPGENYPGLKANRASLLSPRGMFKWLKAVERSCHRRGANDVEQTEKSRSAEGWEAILRIWGVTAQMLRLALWAWLALLSGLCCFLLWAGTSVWHHRTPPASNSTIQEFLHLCTVCHIFVL